MSVKLQRACSEYQAQKDKSWKYLSIMNDNHGSEEERGMKQTKQQVKLLKLQLFFTHTNRYFTLSDMLVLLGTFYR